MTNYERICKDKAFCAAMLADGYVWGNFSKWLQWLDKEQRDLNAEHEREKGEQHE